MSEVDCVSYSRTFLHRKKNLLALLLACLSKMFYSKKEKLFSIIWLKRNRKVCLQQRKKLHFESCSADAFFTVESVGVWVYAPCPILKTW